MSAFLEIDVQATVGGTLADPAVEISAGSFRDVQYLERGARGVRFLNLTRLIGSANVAGGHGVFERPWRFPARAAKPAASLPRARVAERPCAGCRAASR